MKTIDFRKIETHPTFEGKAVIQDISKNLGNSIIQNVADIGLRDFAKEVYYKGEVEIDKRKALLIKDVMEAAGYFIYIKTPVYEMLDKIIKEEKQDE